MRLLIACALVAISLGSWGSSAQTIEMEVDVALVLAVDVSGSMDPDEQQLQRDGFAEAFRSDDVHDAIRRGALGRIAIAYFEWSGATQQKVVIPWTVIAGAEAAAEVAERLSHTPTSRLSSTSISGAIDFAARLFRESGSASACDRHLRRWTE
jgi:hypothetical protein